MYSDEYLALKLVLSNAKMIRLYKWIAKKTYSHCDSLPKIDNLGRLDPIKPFRTRSWEEVDGFGLTDDRDEESFR